MVAGGRPGPLEGLTIREREVLALMADARSNADIARALTVTDAAVSKHVGDIVMKLGLSVSSRPAA
ncbi:helix-turn-helix transcriptional regulator [Microbacterium sp. SORGH_AS_0888]|uniref:helix-turn-helix domain-containing protein n=1 Tax=Microbacterium sp. SORGH_AS_0888 TaxID=3041791 RepID=UPI0027D8612C|nr:helix-turn-helix transcriptional regulator [Microbacterium sp. SORGH_AS_0888]